MLTKKKIMPVFRSLMVVSTIVFLTTLTKGESQTAANTAANPDFKIWKTISLGIDGASPEYSFVNALNDGNYKMDVSARSIINRPSFPVVHFVKMEVNLVKVTVADLGFKKEATRRDIYNQAKKLGLRLCLPEVGPQLRLQYKDQPENEQLHIAMEPIVDWHGNPDWRDEPRIFNIERNTKGFWLNCNNGDLDHVWSDNEKWIFQANPNSKVWKTINLGTLPTPHDINEALNRGNYRVMKQAMSLIYMEAFKISPKETKIDLIKVTVADLGFKKGATLEDIYKRAEELGLELCPPEVGPQLRLQYNDQPSGDLLIIGTGLIGHLPFPKSSGPSGLFTISNNEFGTWIGDCDPNPYKHWPANTQFIFSCPKQPQ